MLPNRIGLSIFCNSTCRGITLPATLLRQRTYIHTGKKTSMHGRTIDNIFLCMRLVSLRARLNISPLLPLLLKNSKQKQQRAAGLFRCFVSRVTRCLTHPSTSWCASVSVSKPSRHRDTACAPIFYPQSHNQELMPAGKEVRSSNKPKARAFFLRLSRGAMSAATVSKRLLPCEMEMVLRLWTML